MPEQRYELTPYGVKYMCDDCGNEMHYTGQMLMSSPPQFVHACFCGVQKNLNDKYPVVRWETPFDK